MGQAGILWSRCRIYASRSFQTHEASSPFPGWLRRGESRDRSNNHMTWCQEMWLNPLIEPTFIYRKSHLTKTVSSLRRKLPAASKDMRTSFPVAINIKASSWQTGNCSVCFGRSGGLKMTTQNQPPELLTGSAKACLPAQVEATLESACPV